jgi:hypothetical protein
MLEKRTERHFSLDDTGRNNDPSHTREAAGFHTVGINADAAAAAVEPPTKERPSRRVTQWLRVAGKGRRMAAARDPPIHIPLPEEMQGCCIEMHARSRARKGRRLCRKCAPAYGWHAQQMVGFFVNSPAAVWTQRFLRLHSRVTAG